MYWKRAGGQAPPPEILLPGLGDVDEAQDAGHDVVFANIEASFQVLNEAIKKRGEASVGR